MDSNQQTQQSVHHLLEDNLITSADQTHVPQIKSMSNSVALSTESFKIKVNVSIVQQDKHQESMHQARMQGLDASHNRWHVLQIRFWTVEFVKIVQLVHNQVQIYCTVYQFNAKVDLIWKNQTQELFVLAKHVQISKFLMMLETDVKLVLPILTLTTLPVNA